MKYVIGVDLGTSAVKTVLVDPQGKVAFEHSEAYPLSRPQPNWSEQNPEDWVKGTIASLKRLMEVSGAEPGQIDGISFSGQMHGLVLVDGEGKALRPAILWNDTRTTAECRKIEKKLGSKLIDIARNRALEGFTLPKILWVQEHEPEVLAKAELFLLPKDYVRYHLTGDYAMDYSDAAGTLLLDVGAKQWSAEIAGAFDLPVSLCPRLVESFEQTGTLLPAVAEASGLLPTTKVFAGGADNACGALGAGILGEGRTMCSIGTSGVALSYESNKDLNLEGKVHFFNHSEKDAFYIMGVTLAAGHSLTWFKETFAADKSFDELLQGVNEIPAGSSGLLFTPYISGERTRTRMRASAAASSVWIPDIPCPTLPGLCWKASRSRCVNRLRLCVNPAKRLPRSWRSAAGPRMKPGCRCRLISSALRSSSWRASRVRLWAQLCWQPMAQAGSSP